VSGIAEIAAGSTSTSTLKGSPRQVPETMVVPTWCGVTSNSRLGPPPGKESMAGTEAMSGSALVIDTAESPVARLRVSARVPATPPASSLSCVDPARNTGARSASTASSPVGAEGVVPPGVTTRAR